MKSAVPIRSGGSSAEDVVSLKEPSAVGETAASAVASAPALKATSEDSSASDGASGPGIRRGAGVVANSSVVASGAAANSSVTYACRVCTSSAPNTKAFMWSSHEEVIRRGSETRARTSVMSE
jgi:hypothetical protein